MADMNDINVDIDDNERANISATLPQSLPTAPMNPSALQSVGGVKYKRKVKNRDTGKYEYTDDDSSGSAFSQGIKRANRSNRRKGFGGKVFIV